jgi:D-alanyl-D-alanine dipeptidase
MCVRHVRKRQFKVRRIGSLGVAKTVYQVITAANSRLRYIAAKNKLEYQMMKILPASYVDKPALKKVQKVVKLSHTTTDHSR